MGFLQSYIGTPFTTRAILELFSHQELYWNSRFLQSYIGTLFYHLSYIGTLTLFSPRVLLKLKVSFFRVILYIIYYYMLYWNSGCVFSSELCWNFFSTTRVILELHSHEFSSELYWNSFQPLELYWNSFLTKSYTGTQGSYRVILELFSTNSYIGTLTFFSPRVCWNSRILSSKLCWNSFLPLESYGNSNQIIE